MPVKKKRRVRPSVKGRNGIESGKEVSLLPEWCDYHGIKTGDIVDMLADGILVVLPPNISKEEEERVRKFLEKSE